MTKILAIASDLGTLAMSLRDKPKRLDYVGLALRTTELLVKLRNEYKLHKARDGSKYFTKEESGVTWIPIPPEFIEMFKKFIVDSEPRDGFTTEVQGTHYPVVGYIGEEKIGWLEKEGKECGFGPYIQVGKKEQCYKILGEKLWEETGSKHCSYTKSKVVAEIFHIDGFRATAPMKDLYSRMKAFDDRTISRSILIQGPPGSGKSSTARWLAREFDSNSLAVEMTETIGTESLETILRAMKPEILILDDLDRISLGSRMLSFLETANKNCKFVIMTTNCKDAMMGAALRPGRIDDIINLNRLDRQTILDMVGNDEQLVDVLEKLPVAYIADFIKRSKALGTNEAVKELPGLLQRASEIEDKTKEEEKVLREANRRLIQKNASTVEVTSDPVDDED